MADVVILVADDAYATHARAMVAGCRREGRHVGDIAFVCPRGSDAARSFAADGYSVLECDERGFLMKFRVFDPFFRRWDRALYLDLDVIVQDDLSRLFAVFDEESDIWLDTEDNPTIGNVQADSPICLDDHDRYRLYGTFFRDVEADAHRDVYLALCEEFPHARNRTFNSAFMLIRHAAIEADITDRLLALQARLEPLNRMSADLAVPGGTDQQIINLLLAPRIKAIPRKLVGWWGFDEPENQVPSPYRGWVGGEVMVALHYSRWHAPWIQKTEAAAAYMNRRLDATCIDVYRRNLAAYEAGLR